MKERRCFGSVPPTILAAAIVLGLLSCGRVETPEETVKAAPLPVWIDLATHLTWAAKDNGYGVTWEMAKTFCSNLTTGGFKWVLPTIDQIETVYYVSENDYGHAIKGNIELTGSWLWSATPAGSGSAWFFGFRGGKRYSVETADLGGGRALCVRRTGERWFPNPCSRLENVNRAYP